MTRVAIVGGGYGGITLARELDATCEVVLVEPKDMFVHSIAALRALVDADFARAIFYPYDRLLERGTVIRGRATRVAPRSVTLTDGTEIEADFVVLATGSTYPFPAKMDTDDAGAALAKLASARAALETAETVLLVGAGPVGLELAGEIRDAWPGKGIAIVDQAPDMLVGPYSDRLRDALRAQLAELHVELHLGAALLEAPPTEPGVDARFVATTGAGTEIVADIWFRCYGVKPVGDLLADSLAPARRDNGSVAVDDHLRVAGTEAMFAIGDVTDVRESKRAGAAQRHAGVVADNIRTVSEGGEPVATYVPPPPALIVPLGRTHGAAELPGPDGPSILSAEETAARKGRDLMTDRYRAVFRLDG